MGFPGSTSTGLDLIRDGLTALNVIADGEQPSSSDSSRGLVILNQMLDTFNGDGLMLFSEQIDDFPLTSNQQIYSYGLGGDFNKPRPTFIDRASIVILSNPAQPLEYPIPIYTVQNWQELVPIKNVPGNLPLLIYDDGSFPLRNITFWPVASDQTLFRSYTWSKLQQYLDLLTPIGFPEGYQECFALNLAVRLQARLYPTAPLSQATIALAQSTMGQLKTNNADDTQLRSDLSTQNTPSRMRSELFNIP